MISIDQKSLRKLVCTLELLRSPVSGEVAAAAAAATRVLNSMGFANYTELFSVLAPARGPEPQPQDAAAEREQPKTSATQTRVDRQYADLAFRIFSHPSFADTFNDVEKKFIEEKIDWARSFSPKMRNWLDKLASMVGVELDSSISEEAA